MNGRRMTLSVLRGWRRWVAIPVALAVLAGVVTAGSADAAIRRKAPPTQVTRSVPGTTPPVESPPPNPVAEAARLRSEPVVWPAGGAVEVAVPSAAQAAEARRLEPGRVVVGGLPVVVGTADDRRSDVAGASPASVQVEVLDQASATRAGVLGVLLRVSRADEVSAAGRIRLELDYTGLRGVIGGDWTHRLRLVRLDGGTPIASTNDEAAGRLVAEVSTDGALLALTAGASGPTGSYTATSLSASATWQVSAQIGDFSWSYPLRVPPAVNGPTPQLAIGYSSGSIDGRTSSTNNQTSWVGEGFEMASGFIERKYVGCNDDKAGGNNSADTGDLCWKTDNATLSLGGRGGELVKDSATGVWRLKNDDGTRVEKLTAGATNPDNDGEYWKVTTTDGSQYYFGLGRRYPADTVNTNSTWTVPVFGNQAGEPCHQASYAASHCRQAWRWNLDYVVDPRGNTMTYFYATETNYYGRNLNQGVSQYVRGGYLTQIDYGERAGSEHTTSAPSQVIFGVSERCLPSGSITCAESQLTQANASYWPDVPYDQICGSSTSCSTVLSPAFFSRKRLTSVTTRAWNGAGYDDVDSWALVHTFPATGDQTSPALWLDSIQHSGKVGGALTLPRVTFVGQQYPNRVDGLDNAPPLYKWRVIAVNSEAGGTVSVNYEPAECTPTNKPASPDSNTMRCMPVFWTPQDAPEPQLHYFHKYPVASIVEDDLTGSGPDVVTSYTYVGSPAWHYDDSELTPAKYRTWGDWRGYGKVQVTRGAVGQTQSRTEQLFLRGMDGDKLAAGGTKDVWVTDSQGGRIEDHPRYQGFVREEITFNGPGGAEVTAAVNTPWLSAVRADDGQDKAYLINIGSIDGRTALAAGGYRRTRVVNTFDSDGFITSVDDRGDTSIITDDRCTRTYYARNTGRHILDTVKRTETVAVNCAATPDRPDDVVDDTRMFYDGSSTFGAAPTLGLVTQTQVIDSYSGSTAVYVTKNRTVYDIHGRPIESYDALGRKTTTAYTPATGGPLTQTVTTTPDPDGTGPVTPLISTTTVSRHWGVPTAEVDANGKRTDLRYDPLGRLIKVWLPGRVMGVDGPHMEFTYTLSPTAPPVVSSKELLPSGSYRTSYQYYDGLLRMRQTDSPAADASGGRVISNTVYDSRGLEIKSNGPYFSSSPPGSGLHIPSDSQVPAQTRLTYDGAGRVLTDAFLVNGIEKWRTTTTYGGDRVNIDPPPGSTATTTINDAQGRTTEMRQYTGGAPSGSYDATRYTYHPAGQLATVTDAMGNHWSYGYDLRGRKITSTDPDSGTSVFTYDNADQMSTSADGRGVTLAYAYDALGRKTAVHDGSLAGFKRASWVYDTLTGAKGKLTSSTRFIGANAYISAVTGYDAGYRPTGSAVTIPSAEGNLAGTYTFSLEYNVDGSLKKMVRPAAGGLFAEALALTYDPRGLPLRLSGNGAYVSNTVYSPYGEPLQYALGNTSGKTSWQTFSYEEGTRRLSRLLVDRQSVATSDADVNYLYDESGNPVKIADTPPGKPADTQCFHYDYLRRLTEAWTATDNCASNPSLGLLGGPAPYWHSFTYNPAGNRLTETQHAGGGDTVRTYSYPAPGGVQPHTLSSIAETGPGGVKSYSYGYDPAANTTARNQPTGNQTLTWDNEGHLGSTTEAGLTTSFVYDAGGNRLIRREPTNTTLYLDGIELRLDHSTQAVTGTGYYTFGDDTIAVRTGGASSTVQFLASDHHGTAEIAIAGTTGTLTQRRHTPFGAPRGTQPGSWPGQHDFVNGVQDPSTGLTHLGAREYDPANGRFISLDPVMDLTDPQQMHGYNYANANPVTFSDPSGLMLEAGGGGGGGGSSSGGGGCTGTPDRCADQAGLNGPVNRTSATTQPGPADELKNKVDAARAKHEQNKQRIINAAKELGKIIMDELGITAGIDCFINGDLGACAETAINVLSSLVGGIAGKLLARYGAPWKWKKGAQLVERLWKLGDEAIDAVKGWFKSRSELRAAEDALSSFCTTNSFTGNTKVLMADGTTKPIKNLDTGDKVIAADPSNGRAGARRVDNVIIGDGKKRLVDITIATGNETNTVTATGKHPFWVPKARRWIDAEDLHPGDRLATSTGQTAQVVQTRPYNQASHVYNLTVHDIHTYYVLAGNTPVLVHNCGVAANTATVDPRTVRYSQDSMTYRFSDGRSIDDTADALKRGDIKPTDIPTVRLVDRDGVLFSLDNRRLGAFQEAGVPMPFRMATADEVDAEAWKFTTTSDGRYIQLALFGLRAGRGP